VQGWAPEGLALKYRLKYLFALAGGTVDTPALGIGQGAPAGGRSQVRA
jgi:hypothetical protein